jgi:predicted GIY-YIG superfamily endonuclease
VFVRHNIGMTYIYALADPNSWEVRYIGKTDDLNQRYYRHLHLTGNTHKENWLRALIRRNVRPLMIVLECLDKEPWQEREKFWIGYYREQGHHLTNATAGGDGMCNPNSETRRKLSNARKSHWNNPSNRARRITTKGRKLSDEHRAKLSAAKLGRRLTDEHRANIAKAGIGRRQSEETRQKLSQIHKGTKGHPMNAETRRKMSLAHKGRKMRAETKDKLSIIRKEYWRKKREDNHES